jgi:hypothetical protein
LLILCFFLQNIGAFAAKTDTLKIQNDETRYLTNQYFLELEDPNNLLLPKNIINNNKFHSITFILPPIKVLKICHLVKIHNKKQHHAILFTYNYW